MKKALWLAAAGLAAASPAAAQTTGGQLFVFGDSLVDSGNAQLARAAVGGEDPAPASLGYFQGRFSNGYNFADYLSQDLFRTVTTASLAGGTNFSVGGAQAAEVLNDASPSFLEQIASFRNSGITFDDDSIVLVTFGGNDVRRELTRAGAGLAPDFGATLTALATGLTQLAGAGARNILVTGLPDIGQIPEVTLRNSPQASALGTLLSSTLNGAFRQTSGQVASATGARIIFYDLFAEQRLIYADPGAFGLPEPLNTRDACLRVPGAAPACTGYVYFDTIHPTTALHGAIGDRLAQIAVPEPESWAMMIAGFAAVGLMARRRQRMAEAA